MYITPFQEFLFNFFLFLPLWSSSPFAPYHPLEPFFNGTQYLQVFRFISQLKLSLNSQYAHSSTRCFVSPVSEKVTTRAHYHIWSHNWMSQTTGVGVRQNSRTLSIGGYHIVFIFQGKFLSSRLSWTVTRKIARRKQKKVIASMTVGKDVRWESTVANYWSVSLLSRILKAHQCTTARA